MTDAVRSPAKVTVTSHAAVAAAADAAVPVVVVGAGACGLTAALALRDAGVECVLLERDRSPSGSTALSSGFVPAAGTRVQRAAGVDDSPARFALDIQHKAHGQAAAHLVEAYACAAGAALDWLGERHGIAFELLQGFLYPGHSALRMHAVPERTGAALVARLERAARSAGATLLGGATARELLVEPGGRVLGVAFVRPDGRRETLACRVLLLACNGFGGNPARVGRWLPAMRNAVFAGHSGNDGTALDWGEALGAATADLGACQGHGSWAVPHGVLVSWALMVEGGVQVNRHGERFHDESQGYSEAAVAVLGQPGGLAWDVFDAPLLELGMTLPDFREARAAGAVRTADDPRALSALIGCAQPALEATLLEIGQRAADGRVDRFGRVFRRALRPPLHAVQVTGALFHTQGGLAVDAACRVLRVGGAPLPNLLAAGGAARGVSGGSIDGYLSGNGLLSAIAGGRIAAGTAVGLLG